MAARSFTPSSMTTGPEDHSKEPWRDAPQANMGVGNNEQSSPSVQFDPIKALKGGQYKPPKPEVESAPGADDAYVAWRHKQTPQNLRAAVNANERTISAAIKSYAAGSDSPLIRQRAEVLAARAIKSYDPDRGAKLSTHLMNQLQVLRREVPDINDPLPKPERLRRETAQLFKVEQELTDKLGRPPTDEEVAVHSNFDPKKIQKLRRRDRASVSEGYLADREDASGEVGNFLPGTQAADPVNTWANYVYHELNNRDRLIFEYRTGWNGREQLSNREIARKLGVAESTVSKRTMSIENRINTFIEEMEA